jgi:glutathione synthase/RimK-type ligase-like ATP-grasp enzyme
MILILTCDDDAHVPRVTSWLDARGARYACFDPARMPAEASVTAAYDGGGVHRAAIQHAGGRIDLDRVTAVWYRRPGLPRPAPEIDGENLRRWVSEVSYYFLLGLWETLDCLFLPGKPSALNLAQVKSYQLAVAARLGFRVPRTVMTNAPEDFLDFYEACEGRLIAKALWRSHAGFPAYTHVVRRRDARGFRSLRHAPVILQEYVPKRVELRVNVVGPRVFAVEIHSQALASTRDDWRRHGDEYPPHLPHALPRDVEARCLRLVRELGLCFGAIDLVLTPDGEYVFLEINPNGQWAWIESLTGLPIGEAVADLLVLGAPALASEGLLHESNR